MIEIDRTFQEDGENKQRHEAEKYRQHFECPYAQCSCDGRPLATQVLRFKAQIPGPLGVALGVASHGNARSSKNFCNNMRKRFAGIAVGIR